jgi:cytochrome c
MSRKLLRNCLLAASASVLAASAVSAERLDIGKREYESNCVACHGVAGKGDGPFNEFLRVKVISTNIHTRQAGRIRMSHLGRSGFRSSLDSTACIAFLATVTPFS